MTEKRIEHLLAYFKGSLTLMDKMKEMHPEKFKDNVKGDIATSIFNDTINVLNHLKTLPTELDKVTQTTDDFDSIFDEFSVRMQSKETNTTESNPNVDTE